MVMDLHFKRGLRTVKYLFCISACLCGVVEFINVLLGAKLITLTYTFQKTHVENKIVKKAKRSTISGQVGYHQRTNVVD